MGMSQERLISSAMVPGKALGRRSCSGRDVIFFYA